MHEYRCEAAETEASVAPAHPRRAETRPLPVGFLQGARRHEYSAAFVRAGEIHDAPNKARHGLDAREIERAVSS